MIKIYIGFFKSNISYFAIALVFNVVSAFCVMRHILSMSLECQFLVASSIFSNIYIEIGDIQREHSPNEYLIAYITPNRAGDYGIIEVNVEFLIIFLCLFFRLQRRLGILF